MKRYYSAWCVVGMVMGLMLWNSCTDDVPELSPKPMKNGEYVLVHEASVSKPLTVVFLGDGYRKEDFMPSGKFLSDVYEGVNILFSVEPFRSYEKYFQVYAVAAYSDEQGMTIPDKQQIRSTRFKVTKVGSGATALECCEDSVFCYAEKVPAVKNRLMNCPIFVLSNEDIYCGTCYQYLSHECIALIPVSRQKEPNMFVDYASILLHEGGGHAIGFLADEYVIHEGDTLPQTGKESVESISNFHNNDMRKNVSVTMDSTYKSYIYWSDLIGVAGYEAITNPEGGLYYSYGVWRSESTGCMVDNRPYFNAADRLAIVQRIMKEADEEFNLQDFIKNDVVKSDTIRIGSKKRWVRG